MASQISDGVTIVAHVDAVDVVWIVEEIERRGLSYRIVRPFRGEPLPTDPGAVICMGGAESAWEVDEHPHLRAELDFLTKTAGADIPVLGICLGSQLLAVALGGTAARGEHGLECGLIEVRSIDGAEHPLAGDLAGTWFSFHSDTFTPPPGATTLAVSDSYAQVWSLGSALAVQFHPEVSAAGVVDFVERGRRKLAAAGLDPDDVIRAMSEYEPTARARCADLLGGWLDTAVTSKSLDHCRY